MFLVSALNGLDWAGSASGCQEELEHGARLAATVTPPQVSGRKAALYLPLFLASVLQKLYFSSPEIFDNSINTQRAEKTWKQDP